MVYKNGCFDHSQTLYTALEETSDPLSYPLLLLLSSLHTHVTCIKCPLCPTSFLIILVCVSPVGTDDSKSQMIDGWWSLPEEQVQARGRLRRRGPKFNLLQNEGGKRKDIKSLDSRNLFKASESFLDLDMVSLEYDRFHLKIHAWVLISYLNYEFYLKECQFYVFV